MRERQPMTQTLKISEVKARLSSLVNDVYRKEARVLVEKSGIPVAALVSAEDLVRLARLDAEQAERERRFAVVDRMRAAFADVPPEELEREAARSVAAARRHRRQRAAAPEPAPRA